MASNVRRYCVFCDKEVKTPTEGTLVAGRESGSSDAIFVHVAGNNCGRQQLTESQTYTMGDADPDDR